MTKFLTTTVAFGFCLLAFSSCDASKSLRADSANATDLLKAPEVQHQIATLRSHDGLSNTLSFETGGPGLLLQDGEVRNMDSDLVFDRWGDEVLSVGRQGRVQSAFRDLRDLKLEGTLGSAFYSLELKDGQVGSDQIHGESERWFAVSKPGPNGVSLPVQRGHCYLASLQDDPDASVDTVKHFLIRVIGYLQDDHVVVRWRQL